MLSPKTIKLDQRWDQRWDTPSQRPRPHTDLLGFGRFLLLPFCWPSKPSYEWYSGSVMVSVAHCGISDWSLVVTVGWQVWQAAVMRSVTPVPLQTEQAHADNPCRHRPPRDEHFPWQSTTLMGHPWVGLRFQKRLGPRRYA